VGAGAEDLLLGDEGQPLAGATTPRASGADDDERRAAGAEGSLTEDVEERGIEGAEEGLHLDVAVAEQRDEALDLGLRARGEDDAQAVPPATRATRRMSGSSAPVLPCWRAPP
jgi:hypothetical protein